MAGLAVLERTPGMSQDVAAERNDAAEREHARKIAENFRRLSFSSTDEWANAKNGENVPFDSAAVEEAPAQPEPAEYPDAAARLADYRPIAPSGHMLFEGLVYKDGQLIRESPASEAAATAEAEAPVAMPESDSDEDALPTRRTMDTLNRLAEAAGEAGTVAQTRTHAFAALSTKTKVVLAVVATVVLLLISLIIVNTSIIGSIQANIASREAELAQLEAQSDDLRAELDWVLSEENIAQWAEAQGMVRE